MTWQIFDDLNRYQAEEQLVPATESISISHRVLHTCYWQPGVHRSGQLIVKGLIDAVAEGHWLPCAKLSDDKRLACTHELALEGQMSTSLPSSFSCSAMPHESQADGMVCHASANEPDLTHIDDTAGITV